MLDDEITQDMSATMAEIETRGGDVQSSETASPPSSQEAVTPAPADPWRTPPQSWKKDYHRYWDKFDPQVMQYIHQREKEALDGIRQYKAVADRWNKAIEPFKQWFDHYKIDPLDAFNRLATSHIILKYGRPEDRKKWAQQLIDDYGLQEVLSGASAPQSQQELQAIRSELDSLRKDLYERQLQENLAVVNAFFADPKNEFAEEVKEDILALLEKGVASTLQEAYEKAIWLNPVVRAKVQQREIENAVKPKRQAPTNLKSSSVSPAPTEEEDESIEDTMKAALARINSR